MVTTRWAGADDLERPRLRVDRNVLRIDDGRLLTSAGVTAGIDLRLHLVRKDLGAAVANEIARKLVAARSGLGSSTSLRARFRDAVGTTPTAYRRAFRATGDAA